MRPSLTADVYFADAEVPSELTTAILQSMLKCFELEVGAIASLRPYVAR